jgi:hypothetical protein
LRNHRAKPSRRQPRPGIRSNRRQTLDLQLISKPDSAATARLDGSLPSLQVGFHRRRAEERTDEWLGKDYGPWFHHRALYEFLKSEGVLFAQLGE